jgi:dihydrofolate reductase
MRCSVYIAMSLDGFIARRDGSIDWLSSVERAGEDYGYKHFHDSIDTIVVGRNTYNQVLGFSPWPYAGKRCIVMTHSPPAPRHGEEFFDGPPQDLVAKLAAEGARHAYVDGGAVIQQFLRAGLIDALTVSIIPTLLGEGIRLFGPADRDIPLRFSASRAFDSGLVQLEYFTSDTRPDR